MATPEEEFAAFDRVFKCAESMPGDDLAAKVRFFYSTTIGLALSVGLDPADLKIVIDATGNLLTGKRPG